MICEEFRLEFLDGEIIIPHVHVSSFRWYLIVSIYWQLFVKYFFASFLCFVLLYLFCNALKSYFSLCVIQIVQPPFPLSNPSGIKFFVLPQSFYHFFLPCPVQIIHFQILSYPAPYPHEFFHASPVCIDFLRFY